MEQQKTPVLSLKKVDFSTLAVPNSCDTPNQFLHSMSRIDLLQPNTTFIPEIDTNPAMGYAQEPSPPNHTLQWEDCSNYNESVLTMGFEAPPMVRSTSKRNGSSTGSTNRETFLEKNRVAAMKCRQKKKEYVSNLESRAERLTNENYALKAELERCRAELNMVMKQLHG